jgi:DNA-binding transcriptional ArsR family regulator
MNCWGKAAKPQGLAGCLLSDLLLAPEKTSRAFPLLAVTGWVAGRAYRHAQLRSGLIDGRAVAAILGFVAVIAGGSIGLAFALRAVGVHYPAIWACLAGGPVMGLAGPGLNRMLRRFMLGNRTGSGPMSAARFDELIHAPTRLAIVSLLAASEWADFKFIRDSAGLFDSALSKQLTILEEAGYIEIRKSFVGKRPRTSDRLTRAGRAAFELHVAALQEIVVRSGTSILPS